MLKSILSGTGLITYNLELAVLALARIMCANIHSQNGTAILAQVLLITQVGRN